MQDHSHTSTKPIDEGDAPLWTPTLRRRALLALIAALCVLLLVVVPPTFSVSRYQRRVATAISGALGRPVHFDSITVHLLPTPGFTINNFVVSENPEFGWEPVLRANTVDARVRVSSLWRRRIEIATISLDAPSINLVRRKEDGRWNLQGILMQAAQLQSAPTAQRHASDAPRFPYIEATDARINIKNGALKLPFSVKEAEFALWLPQPDQWHVRIVGKPVRTDTDVDDVGLLRVEGTLGRAADLSNAPIAMEAGWKSTPLGEASKLTAGYDLGWRGDIYATAALHGTLGAGRLVTDVHLRSLHREDLLPEHTIDTDAHCEAATAGLLHSLHDVRCAVPTDNSLSFAGVLDALRRLPSSSASDTLSATAKPGVALLQGEMPDMLDWQSASGSATLNHAAPNYALAWARLFTRSIAPSLSLEGTFDLTASLQPGGDGPRLGGHLLCLCTLPQPATPVQAPAGQNLWALQFALQAPSAQGASSVVNVSAAPVPAAKSALQVDADQDLATLLPDPSAPLHGSLSRDGYSLDFDSRASITQAALLIPCLADGLEPSAAAPLQVTSGWHTPQTWTTGIAAPANGIPRRHRHRR